MRLVPAQAVDWDAAWEVQRAAFLDLVTRTAGGWTPALVEQCAAAWRPQDTRLVLQDDTLVGWVRLEHHPDHDWLDLVVLHPTVQGRGLGTRLMRRLFAEAEQRQVPLWLSVYRVNEARRLYARLGMAELPRDEVRVFMVHPADTVLRPPR